MITETHWGELSRCLGARRRMEHLKKKEKVQPVEFNRIGLNCNFSNGNLLNKNAKGRSKLLRGHLGQLRGFKM